MTAPGVHSPAHTDILGLKLPGEGVSALYPIVAATNPSCYSGGGTNGYLRSNITPIACMRAFMAVTSPSVMSDRAMI